jgi:hypothetical protein
MAIIAAMSTLPLVRAGIKQNSPPPFVKPCLEGEI